MHDEPKSKAKRRLLIVAVLLVIVGVIGLALTLHFYSAWKDEPLKEAQAISLGEQLSAERATRLITQARDIVAGKPYSLPPQNSGLMWDDQYGYPEELSDIRPVQIFVISNDEVWFVLYKFFDVEVVIAVVGLTGSPKVILRTGHDDKYQFHDRKIVFEE